jgi:TrmH family RNA methyltransferase
MEPRSLTSLQNPVAQRFRKVLEAGRGRREGVFVLEGRHLLEEALTTGWPVEVLVLDRDLWPRISRDVASRISPASVYLAPRDLLARLGTTPSPEGILALCSRRESAPGAPSPGDLYLYLDRVQDPANVGMLVRSARAFGLAGVFCGRGTADPFGPTALSRSAGAALHLSPVAVAEEEFLAWATSHRVHILAADASGHPPVPVQPGAAPRALAVGNEGRGLSPTLRDAAAAVVSIPMAPGWDSLNVAVAGAILMYILAMPAPSGQGGWLSATAPSL